MIHPAIPTHSTSSLAPHWLRLRAGCFCLLVLVLIYIASVTVPPGWLTYALSVPALLVILLTAFARVSDIGTGLTSAFWNVRRMGLVLAGAYAVWVLSVPLYGGQFPTWRNLIGMWGFALVWLTSPYLPPWQVYIWRRHDGDDYEHA